MQKILISSCLLGNKVRYDGQSKPILHPQVSTWLKQDRLVVICPEVCGGLSIPRARAERFNLNVINELGDNVTDPFLKGAQIALELCSKHNIKYALLKEFSPSCGVNVVYDGTFSGHKVPGQGVTSQRLREHGITVFSELEIDKLAVQVNMNT